MPADEFRCHETVGTALGILTLTGGVDVSVKGVSYWRGDGARLAWAVFTHAQSQLLACGFSPMMPSHTAIGYYGDQILDAEELPIRVCAFAPCLPSAADQRTHRTHQVEQIVLCRPEDSGHWFDECQRNVEDILRDLELPYRVARVCIGDLGAPAHKAYETSCWFPGAGVYRKTHSNSHFTDYQARRRKIRYLDRGRVAQPHTLAATGVTDGVVLAILENHVRPDGSVRIPDALRPYLGGQKLIEPRATRAR
ncbi:MAG: aminoacyl--tRNA ligase-related protein [Pseudonocardiaceae bacterium]